MKRYLFATIICWAGVVSGCDEKNTIAPDLGFLDIDARTVEALLPFTDFVDDVQVFGGYGSASDLGRGIVANDSDGFNARTLIHLGPYPEAAEIPGTLTFSDGRIVLFFDTLRGSVPSPVDVEVFGVQEDWHAPTVTWEAVVDTAGDQTPWSQPGGGVPTLLGSGTFDVNEQPVPTLDPPRTDSLSIDIDAATVAILGDTTNSTTGLLVALPDPGTLLHLVDLRLRISTVASNVPDTTFEVTAPITDVTFIFDPVPMAPAGWLRVAGTPSWRSVITMSIPRTITGTPEVCGTVGCEVDLTEVDLNLAELVLTTRQTEAEFQPMDATRLSVRPVLNPELLPKSPLGAALLPFPKIIPPELFSTQAGTPVALSMTTLVQRVLGLAVESGTVPEASIAIFSIIEPDKVGFASFEGLGGAGAPALRLLYTVANDVGLP